jgi:hypothetical protein
MLDGNDPKKLKKKADESALNQLVKNIAYFLGEKSNATEFTQYRNPVGLGPSLKT